MRRLSRNVFAEGIMAKITPSYNIDLARNEFYTEDDWFQIGLITENGTYYTVKETQFYPTF